MDAKETKCVQLWIDEWRRSSAKEKQSTLQWENAMELGTIEPKNLDGSEI